MLGLLVATCSLLAEVQPFQPFWHQLERRQGTPLQELALESADPLVIFATRAITPERSFRELLVSWNVDCPAGSGFWVDKTVVFIRKGGQGFCQKGKLSNRQR